MSLVFKLHNVLLLSENLYNKSAEDLYLNYIMYYYYEGITPVGKFDKVI